jgi:hypothetical protein
MSAPVTRVPLTGSRKRKAQRPQAAHTTEEQCVARFVARIPSRTDSVTQTKQSKQLQDELLAKLKQQQENVSP